MRENLKIVEAERSAMEANLKRMIMNNRREVGDDLDTQLEKVFQQLRKISNSYDDQEKLLEDRIADMVNKELTTPSLLSPQEKIIIREGKQVAVPANGGVGMSDEDRALISKLKNTVIEMELSAANNNNLIERLNEQCEMASKRARESEDLVTTLEQQLIETTGSMETSFLTMIEEQAEKTKLSFEETNSTFNKQLEDGKEQVSGERGAMMRSGAKRRVMNSASCCSQCNFWLPPHGVFENVAQRRAIALAASGAMMRSGAKRRIMNSASCCSQSNFWLLPSGCSKMSLDCSLRLIAQML